MHFIIVISILFRLLLNSMVECIISLAILAQLVYGQNLEDYENKVVSSTQTGPYLNSLNDQCVENCNQTCVTKCPEAELCKDDEIQCGKKDLPPGVWPDCMRDDICVPDDCDCPVNGNDGSECPRWCVTTCTDTQIKCPGGIDDNGCKESDVCIDRPLGNDDQLCPGYCPVTCDLQHEHICSEAPENGCPKPPTCKTKEVDHSGDYCDEQHCVLICEEPYKFCSGSQMLDGCMEADICVPKGTADSGAYCDGNCPVTCDPTFELKCDGTPIYIGPKSGCFNPDTCTEKARDVNGDFCPDNSDSHGCEEVCPEGTHKCPTRTLPDNCKEQQTCTTCTLKSDGTCCPPASDCPALCQPHEVECKPPGHDEEYCPLPGICVVQERDYYGDLCTVHCPGVCNEEQIMCPGGRDDTGCKEPDFCEPLAHKLWGEDKGALCPGFCPADCKDWEQYCDSVRDPCDGCPTEPVCKPKAKDINGINCPPESASHGCDISCKTLDGFETICAAYEDPLNPECKESLTCLPRTTGTDGSLCPAHSVCPKKCGPHEKQCLQGYDDNDCKEEDLCIRVPDDYRGTKIPCSNFECPPKCDEEVQKYCQGAYVENAEGQLCPLRDYCVDRPLDNNDIRCPGHCLPDCAAGKVAVPQAGKDTRGCPLMAECRDE